MEFSPFLECKITKLKYKIILKFYSSLLYKGRYLYFSKIPFKALIIPVISNSFTWHRKLYISFLNQFLYQIISSQEITYPGLWVTRPNETYTYTYMYMNPLLNAWYKVDLSKGWLLLLLQQDREIKMEINIMFLSEIYSPVGSKHFTLLRCHLWVLVARDLLSIPPPDPGNKRWSAQSCQRWP